MRIRILLADSHPAFLTALSRCLRDQEDIEVIGQAKDGGAVELTQQLTPDIVLMDIDTSVPASVNAGRQIHRDQPDIKIIVLSVDPVPLHVRQMFKAAASGYLLKDCEPERLLAAIRTVAQGGTYVSLESDCRPQDDPKQGT